MKVINEKIYPVDKTMRQWRGILDYEVCGKAYRKWFRGSSCADVTQRIIAFVRDNGTDKGSMKSMKYGDFITSVFLSYKRITIKLSSYSRIYSVYLHHCSVLSDKSLSSITSMDCLNYLDDMKSRGFSKSSMDKVYEFWNNSFNYAMQNGYLEKNPLFNVAKPCSDVPKKAIQTYSLDDMDKFELCIDSVSLSDYRYSVPFLYYTGLRLGELLALDKSDFDFNSCTVSVRSSLVYTFDHENDVTVKFVSSTKTNNGVRVVPLSEPALYYSRKLFSLNRSPYFICTSVGTRVVPRNYSRMLQKLCKKAGVEYKGVHALRHSFATEMIRRGVPVKYVSELLGHADIQTTLNLYVHSDLTDKKNAVDVLARKRV